MLDQRELWVMLFIWTQRRWLCHLNCPVTSPTRSDLLHWGGVKLCPGFCAAVICFEIPLLALQLWWGHVVSKRAALHTSALQKHSEAKHILQH